MGVYGGSFSFASSSIPIKEAMVAQKFRGALLSPLPGLSEQPGLLRSLAINEFLVEVAPSPLEESDIPKDGAIIAVGSAAFNAASNWIERDMKPRVKFTTNNTGIEFTPGAKYTDPAVGFITRLLDEKNSRFVFYVAGPSEEATAASLQYLLENWHALEKRFRSKNTFAVAVRVISTSPLRGQIETYAE